jgi:hypothetical protein
MLIRCMLLPAMFSALLLLASCTDSRDVFVRQSTMTEGETGPTAYAIPQGNTFDSPVSVILSTDEPAAIYYALDGSDPLVTLTEYTTPITISETGITLLRFAAIDRKGNAGVIVNESYCLAGTPQSLAQLEIMYSSPDIAVDSGGVVHIVWQDIVGGPGDIFYANSSDWGAPVNLTNTAASCLYPRIAIDSEDVVHVVWQRSTGIFAEVYYVNSTDWKNAVNISDSSDASEHPDVAVDSADTVHAVWREALPSGDELRHACSPDWAAATIVSTGGDLTSHAICTGPDGALHAVWVQYVHSSQCLYYANSSDWASTQVSVEKVLGQLNEPAVASDSRGVIHLIWARVFSPDHAQIHYWNTGMLDEEPLNLSQYMLYSNSPSIAVTQDDVVHAVWVDCVTYTSLAELRRAKICSPDAIALATVSDTLSRSSLPSIAADSSGNIHLTWHEEWAAYPQSLYYMNSGK